MRKLNIYQVDAFTDRPFGGNPAAVCPLDEWLPDALMQNIALENNLAETAFYVPTAGGFHIRWFTPAVEVDLCGHATLASAHVLYSIAGYAGEQIEFRSRSGSLLVRQLEPGLYSMDFPADRLEAVPPPVEIAEGLGVQPQAVFRGRDDFLAILGSEEEIRALNPDFRKLAQLDSRGVIATAAGKEVDFVSRGFFPQSGVDEDPATGSAHTTLPVYWAKQLGKTQFKALQLSKRVGQFEITLRGDRVDLVGSAQTYLEGTIFV
ncbi:MAG: PhzF family phenazine biosynthesis protein [Bacteroidota bacterium]